MKRFTVLLKEVSSAGANLVLGSYRNDSRQTRTATPNQFREPAATWLERKKVTKVRSEQQTVNGIRLAPIDTSGKSVIKLFTAVIYKCS